MLTRLQSVSINWWEKSEFAKKPYWWSGDSRTMNLILIPFISLLFHNIPSFSPLTKKYGRSIWKYLCFICFSPYLSLTSRQYQQNSCLFWTYLTVFTYISDISIFEYSISVRNSNVYLLIFMYLHKGIDFFSIPWNRLGFSSYTKRKMETKTSKET